MAKKESKKTRESQYAEILSKQGVTLAECTVLGFKFPDDMHAYGFHFDIMTEPKPIEHLLFDAMADGTAIVVIRKDAGNADRIKAIAEQAGGTGFTPNLNQ